MWKVGGCSTNICWLNFSDRLISIHTCCGAALLLLLYLRPTDNGEAGPAGAGQPWHLSGERFIWEHTTRSRSHNDACIVQLMQKISFQNETAHPDTWYLSNWKQLMAQSNAYRPPGGRSRLLWIFSTGCPVQRDFPQECDFLRLFLFIFFWISVCLSVSSCMKGL